MPVEYSTRFEIENFSIVHFAIDISAVWLLLWQWKYYTRGSVCPISLLSDRGVGEAAAVAEG